MTVAELRDLLGHDVLLLAWPHGSKGEKRKWGHLTVADMTPAYLKALEAGNIGVVLGKKSGNLVALDLDTDEMVEFFIAANPLLNTTLQTHGSRGRVFWLRMVGAHPAKTVKLKIHSGDDCGEFRSNGSQSIIHGIHPNGNPYQVVNMTKPLTVKFADLVWPAQIKNPPTGCLNQSLSDTEGTELQSDRVTEAISVTLSSLSSPSLCLTVRSVEHAVELAMPSKDHQNHERLFTLARAVKNLEMQTRKFTPVQLRDIFNLWFSHAGEFLRPEQTRDDYLAEFLNAYASAKVPLGEGVIAQAWKSAQEKTLPLEAIKYFEHGKLRILVALCRELQTIAGKEPFYLSARTVQQLFKLDGHATAARWLRSLCVVQILTEIEKGSGVRASRYRFNFTSG